MLMNFGKKLKKLREKFGLSQQQLADALGLGASTIGQYETNSREPNFQRLKLIVDFFNVDYNFLLQDNEDDIKYIKEIELDIVDLVNILRKNYITIDGKKMSEEAVEGLIQFFKHY